MDPIKIKEGFQEALLLSGQNMTIEDVERSLSSGQSMLWVGENSALITELTQDEFGWALHIWLGTGDLGDLVSLEPGLSAWARAHGCYYLSLDGRKGWERVLKPIGFHFVNGELRKYYEV